MAGNWRQGTVSELQAEGILLVEDGNHGESRPRHEEFTNTGVAFIRAADMDNGSVLFAAASKINETARRRITKGIGAPGDVLLSHKGTVGKVALVPDDAPSYVCSPQTTLWRSRKPDVLDRRYLFAFLRSPNFHAQLASRSGETDMAPYVSLTAQRTLLVDLPPIEHQRAIAHILGTLDDKIELNRRTNETLEAIARALFKSWFVDFDPVRAKAAGKQPAGMDVATAALFPSEFVKSEIGEIPKGWSATILENLTSKIGSGATPRGGDSVYAETGISFIRSQNVYDSQFVWKGLARISEEQAGSLSGVTVHPNDVLLNITGASILRTCVVESALLPARVNQHVAIVRANSGIPPHFIHQHLLREETKAYLMGMDAGASRQAITKGHIAAVPIVLPCASVLRRFAEITDSAFVASEALRSQSRTLVGARDALLPRLLSGELRVPDAERIVGAAT